MPRRCSTLGFIYRTRRIPGLRKERQVECLHGLLPEFREITARKSGEETGGQVRRLQPFQRGGHGTRILQPCLPHHSGETSAGEQHGPPPAGCGISQAPVPRETGEQFSPVREKHGIRAGARAFARGSHCVIQLEGRRLFKSRRRRARSQTPDAKDGLRAERGRRSRSPKLTLRAAHCAGIYSPQPPDADFTGLWKEHAMPDSVHAAHEWYRPEPPLDPAGMHFVVR